MTLMVNVTNLLSFVLIAQAGPLSVSELLTNADRYNRQPVTVVGTISDFRTKRRRWGPVYTFDLSDGSETVRVTTFSEPPCQSGTVTVEGTFEAVKWRMRGNYSFEEITAHNIICPPDSSVDPRGPKGK